ncbi:MAG: hypothetical protein HZC26_03650 [Candidatus Magasanikbacteria bacterium]|nr:hypothetical protein [Candidatus Magasanikbacteria bacterium]
MVDNKLQRLMPPTRQPDYLIVYDDMWEKIIESYFIRESGTATEDEPDDTLNGPIEKARRDEFIKVLNERYPEKERFKIRVVGADSIESIKADIKWVVED